MNKLSIQNLYFDGSLYFHFYDFQIMALLAPIIGAEKTIHYFLQRYLDLCTSENYDIRKMCAIYCPHLCKVVGIDVSEKYLVGQKTLITKSGTCASKTLNIVALIKLNRFQPF